MKVPRALSMPPGALLRDEPLGALAALTGVNLPAELMKLVNASGCTSIMVTHDVDETELLSDRTATMTNGPAASFGQVLAADFPRSRVPQTRAQDVNYLRRHREVLRFLYGRPRIAA